MKVLPKITHVRRYRGCTDDDVEQDVPLSAENHQGTQPDVGVQPPELVFCVHDGIDQVHGEGSEKLRDRLHDVRHARTHPHIDADRHPYEARNGDQDAYTQECEKPEQYDVPYLRRIDFGEHEPHRLQQRNDVDELDGPVPDEVAESLPPRVDVRFRTYHDWRARQPPDGENADEQARYDAEKQRPPHHRQRPRSRWRKSGLLLKSKPVCAGDERPEQELVINENDNEHGGNGPPDRATVALLDRERHIGAHPGKRDLGIADVDRFGGHYEEPATRHGHHHVPDERWHGERHFQPPEAHPWAQAETARRFVQLVGDAAQRVIEAERHVPRLAGEDEDDGGHFRARDSSRRQ